MTKVRGRVFVILAALLLSSCAPTTALTRVWRDESYQGPVGKILVIGIAQDQVIRHLFEDEFTAQLRNRHVEAIPSNTVLKSEQMADQNAITAKSKELGVDAVLITRPIDRKTVKALIPVGSSFTPCVYYGDLATYYATACGYHEPISSVVYDDEVAYLETNLYEGRSEKLIWSAFSEMWLVESEIKLIRSFVSVMMQKLIETKLIQ